MLTGAAFVAATAVVPAAMAAAPAVAGWQVVKSPGGDAALAGVTAASRSNFWAVGVSHLGDVSGRPLILHQSGTGAWKVVDVPALHVPGRFAGVGAQGTKDVWAVGVKNAPSRIPLTAHFDGTSWRPVATPPLLGSGAVLNSVSVLGPKDAWAVGTRTVSAGIATLVEHWNGTAWHVVSSPNADTFSELHAVVALSPTNVWAVGKKGDEFVLPLIEHFDGKAWTIVNADVPVPHAELIGLQSISAVNARDIWAVGQGNLTEHWDGTAWHAVKAPVGSTDPDASSVLNGVSARSSKDVWAVGSVSGTPGPKAVTMHWDGVKWSLVPANAGSGSAILNAVTAPVAGPSVAVGYRLSTTNATLILRNAK
jgi:hypothetical protein